VGVFCSTDGGEKDLVRIDVKGSFFLGTEKNLRERGGRGRSEWQGGGKRKQAPFITPGHSKNAPDRIKGM